MFKLGKNGKKTQYRTLQYKKYNQNVTIQFLKTWTSGLNI